MKIDKMLLLTTVLMIGTVVSIDAYQKKTQDREMHDKEQDLKAAYTKKRADLTHKKEIAELDYKKGLEHLRDKKIKLKLDYKHEKISHYEHEKQKAAIDYEIDKLRTAHSLKILALKNEEKLAEIEYNEKRRKLKEERK